MLINNVTLLLQVGFIGGICIPCFDLLSKVLPSTQPMLNQCKENLNTWKSKSEQQEREAALDEEEEEEEH